MRTRLTLPELPIGHPMEHQWTDTGRQWSATHSGENDTFEKRCRWCGKIWFAGQDDEPRDACPDRPIPWTPAALARWADRTPPLFGAGPPIKRTPRQEERGER